MTTLGIHKYDVETLKNEIKRREKINAHRGFELPTDVRGEIMSYFHKPILSIIQPLPLKQLIQVYRNIFPLVPNTSYSKCSAIPLDERKKWYVSRLIKKHRVTPIDKQIRESIVEQSVGGLIDCNVDDIIEYEIGWKVFTCIVKKVNAKTYGVEIQYMTHNRFRDTNVMSMIAKIDAIVYSQTLQYFVYERKNIKKALIVRNWNQN